MYMKKCQYGVVIVHFLLTFWWELWIFTGNPYENIMSYLVIKGGTLAVIATFWHLFFVSIAEKNSSARKIMLYTLPYALLLIVQFFRHTHGVNYFFTPDEGVICKHLTKQCI